MIRRKSKVQIFYSPSRSRVTGRQATRRGVLNSQRKRSARPLRLVSSWSPGYPGYGAPLRAVATSPGNGPSVTVVWSPPDTRRGFCWVPFPLWRRKPHLFHFWNTVCLSPICGAFHMGQHKNDVFPPGTPCRQAQRPLLWGTVGMVPEVFSPPGNGGRSRPYSP